MDREPAAGFDTRVYYYWTKLKNNSDLVEYGNAPTTPLASGLGCGNYTPASGIPTTTVGNCDSENYNYTKNNVGFDAWWKFARGQRLGFGWDYTDLDQDALRLRQVALEQAVGRVQEHDARHAVRPPEVPVRQARLDANFGNDPLPNGGANNPNYLLPYTSAFDLQSSTTNLLKLYLDWNPMANVGLSFEGNWAKVDFDDVTRPHQVRPAGLLPERLLERVRTR